MRYSFPVHFLAFANKSIQNDLNSRSLSGKIAISREAGQSVVGEHDGRLPECIHGVQVFEEQAAPVFRLRVPASSDG